MASPQSADSFALVERFVGQPISRDDQGNVSELLLDAKVGLGSEIITDAQSSVTLLLPDGSRVDVGRNSAFKLGDDVLIVSDSFPDSSLDIAETDSSTAELDAELLQALIEAGADPTEITEATAAGASAAGGQSVVGGFGTISVSGIGVTTTPGTSFTTSNSTGQSIIPFVVEEGIAGSVDSLLGGGLQNLAPQLGVLSFTISEDPDGVQALFSEGPAVSDPDNLTGDLTVIAVIPEQGSFFLADGTLLSEGPLELSGTEFNGLSFLPDPNANDELLGGPVSFDFVVIDPEGAGLPGSVTISVLPVEDTPVLSPDNVSIEEDSSTIQIDVLENDNDPDGDTLSVVSAEVDPSVGIVSVGENGIVSFTPAENYFGEAEITYGVTDGNTPIVFSTVQISVTGTNDAPVILIESGDSTAASLTETNTALSTSGTLTLTDVDTINMVSASVQSVSANDQLPAGIENTTLLSWLSVSGALDGTETSDQLSWSFNSGSALDALDANDSLVLTYVVRADDGIATTDQNVVITITGTDDAAVVTGTVAGNVVEDGIAIASGTLTITDADADDAPSFADTTQLGTYGSFTLSGGTWTYTLDQSTVQDLDLNDQVTDTVTFTASDSTTQDVTVTITGTDDAAVVTGTVAGNVVEDGIAIASGTLTITDADADDAPSFADTTQLGTYGSFTLSGGTWTYTLDQSTVQDLDLNDQVTDTVTFTASDSTTQDVTVTITGTDDAAVVTGTVAGNVVEDGIAIASGTLTITDADADDAPSFADTTQLGTYGSFTLSGGTWTYTLDQSTVQDLDLNDQVTDTVTFTASDSTTQDVTVTITGTNDAPVLTVADVDAVEDGPTATGTASATDADDDSNATYIISTGPSKGSASITADGTYTFDPGSDFQNLAAGETEDVTFQVTVTDDEGGQDVEIVTVTVTGTNDAPVANDDPGSPTLINFELGVSSGSSSISDWGVLNNLGQIEFQGDGIAGRITGFRNDAASDVTFNSSNGLGVSGGNSEINLNEALRFDFDDPAVLTELTLSSLGGRFQNQEARVGWSAEQSDGTIVSGTFDQPTSSTETVELPGSLGSIVQLSLYVEATSEANFTVKAISGSASVDAIVLEEDSSVELLAADLLANDTDVDGDTLTINEINGQSVDLFNSAQADIAIDNGVLSFDGAGGMTFTPDSNFFGQTSFEYQVSDGNGGLDTAEVAFRVRSINDEPEISVGSDTYNTNEDIPLVIPAGDISIADVEDSDLTPSFSANNGRVDIQSDGSLLYTPELNWSGTDTITVTVVDSNGAEARETFEVTVDPVNDAPVANDDPVESFMLGGTNVESDWGTLSNGVYSFNSGGITGSISGSQDLSFQTGSNFGIGARGSEIDVNENVVFQFDSPVSNAQIGLGSLGSHYNAGSSQNARVIWEARDSDGNLVSQGEVRSDQANSDGDNNRTTNTIEIPESFSQLTLYTLANQNSNFTVQSFSADVANAQVIDAGDTLVADASSGVLANDTDPEGDDLTVIGVGQEGSAVQAFSGSTTVSGQYGTLTIDAEGSYQYQATTAQELSSGQQATDRFVYQISDGELDDTATLSFNVQGINDAPELALVANRVTQSAAKAGDEAATFSVTDPDNDAIGIEFDGTVPVDSEGNAIYTISADSVQLTQAGADLANQGGPLPEISLRASDGTLSDSASVTPSINQTPTISGSPAILGLQADYYAADSISNLEQFKAIVDGVPDASFVSTGLNYSVGSGDLGAGSNLQSFLGEDSATLSSDPADSDAAGLHLSGQIYLTAGDYQFFSYTDDGFELTVAGEQAGVFSGNRGPGTTSGNTITIDSDGWVDLEALWWDNGGQYVLQVSVAKGGGDPVLLVQDNFAFRSGENTILVETGAGLTGGGELSIADVDTSDEVTLMVQGSPSLSGFVGDLSASDLASMLTISTSTPNPILDTSEQSDTASVEFNSGSQTFSYLEAGQYLSITYTVVASDGASSSTYPVTIQILGSSGGQITGPSSSSPLIQAQSLTDTGLLAEYYGTNSGISNLDTFKALVASETPTSTFVSTGLDYEQRGGNLGRDDNLQSWIGDDQDSLSQNPDSTNKAGLFVKGQVYLEAGVYQFRTTTDDGFELSVNGRLAGQYASNTGARVVTGDPITVAADGWVDLEAYWWDNGGKYVLDVEVSKDNGSFESLNEESGFEFRHGPNLSLAETDGSLEETGSLQVSDPDAEESVLVQIKPDAPIQVVGEVGEITTSQLENMFALTGGDSVTAVASGQTSGQVEYQFNSGAETFSHLGAGDTLEITYTVEAFDGVNRVEHPVTIRIVGTGPSLNGSPTQVDSGNDYGWLNTPSGEIPSLWSGTELESSSASRSINALRFELSGIKNGADEVLVLDGNDIAMQDDETSISGDVQITVTQISSETFNIEVSTASGWTNSEASSLVDSIAFRHDGTDPETDRTEGVREIRLVEVSETTGSTETPTSTTQLSDVSVELYIGIPQIYGADGSYSNDFAGESDPFGSPQTAQDDLLVFSDMPAEAQAPDQNGVLADDVLLLAGGAGNDVFVAIDREFSSDGSASTTELGPIKAQISDFGLELDADNNLVANTEQDTLDLSQLLESNAGAIAELEVNGNGDAVISVTSSGNELLAEITLGAHDGLVLTDSVSMQDLIDENVIKLV